MTTIGQHQDSHFLHDHQPLFDWGQPTSGQHKDSRVHQQKIKKNSLTSQFFIPTSHFQYSKEYQFLEIIDAAPRNYLPMIASRSLIGTEQDGDGVS